MIKRFLLPVLLLAVVLIGASCSSDDGGDVSASGSSSGSSENLSKCDVRDGTTNKRDTEVHATLKEWAITVDKDSVSAGNVEFHATNSGKEKHELVLIKGAKPGDLKLTADGVDEDTLSNGAAVIGEIEGIKAGEECAGTFKLAAGDYTLVCNIVDDMGHAHAKMGMITGFTVS